MTYEETYMNCKSKAEFRKMLWKDIFYATLLNKDRLKPIEDAMNKVCQVHPDWADLGRQKGGVDEG